MQFDKAFVIELCLHTLFCAIESEKLRVFISGKPYNSELQQDFQHMIMKTGCFKNEATIDGLKMNSGETACTFYVYTKTETKKVDTTFINELMNVYGFPQRIIEDVVRTWNDARYIPDTSRFSQRFSLEDMEGVYSRGEACAQKAIDEQRSNK